jgi:hypothetical protein
MSQSNLKKEFSKSTVQRMRNIITGNAGDRTQIQSGWEKKNTDYSEGDIWEENGKQWTIKNGIKQTITKLDGIKRLAVLPLTCPCCNKPMKIHDLNKKMYTLHNMCFDCVIDMETKIRIDGKWDEYVSKQRNASKNASLEDFENAVESWMNQNDSFITENGDIESWSKVDKTKIYNELKSNIENLKKIQI